MEPAERERGSGTVLTLGALGVAMTLFAAIIVLASAQQASARARTAADLAALAAAMDAGRSGEACTSAARIAAANGARVVTCTDLGGGDHEVVTAVQPAAGWLGEATARARAGPELLRTVPTAPSPPGPAR